MGVGIGDETGVHGRGSGVGVELELECVECMHGSGGAGGGLGVVGRGCCAGVLMRSRMRVLSQEEAGLHLNEQLP